MSKKVLVCGATGFLGRNIVERLVKRNDLEIYGVYHDKPRYNIEHVDFSNADLRCKSDVDRVISGKDIIIQMAATTSGMKDIRSNPAMHVTDNVVMSSLIFRSAYDQKIPHIIFPSCTIMYPSSDRPLKEDDFDPRRNISKKYFGAGITKVYLEQIAKFYAELGQTKFTVFRHSNVYGPHDKFDQQKSHVFAATIAKVVNASEKITVIGEGNSARDLLYVDDIVDFVELAMERQATPYELVNVGEGSAIKIRDLVSRIIQSSGKKLHIEYDTSRPSEPDSICVDASRAKEIFGWEPKVSLDEGIKKTLEWYKNNSSYYI